MMPSKISGPGARIECCLDDFMNMYWKSALGEGLTYQELLKIQSYKDGNEAIGSRFVQIRRLQMLKVIQEATFRGEMAERLRRQTKVDRSIMDQITW